MAAIFTKVAQVGLKTGGKFATKAVAKGGAKKFGKVAGKKGIKSIGKQGGMKKLLKSEVKNALLNKDIGEHGGGGAIIGGSGSRKRARMASPSTSPKRQRKQVRIKSPSPDKKKRSKSADNKPSRSKSKSRSKSAEMKKGKKSEDEKHRDKDKKRNLLSGAPLMVGGFGGTFVERNEDEKTSDRNKKNKKKKKEKSGKIKEDSDESNDSDEEEVEIKKVDKRKVKKGKHADSDSEEEVKIPKKMKTKSKKSTNVEEEVSRSEDDGHTSKDKKKKKDKGKKSKAKDDRKSKDKKNKGKSKKLKNKESENEDERVKENEKHGRSSIKKEFDSSEGGESGDDGMEKIKDEKTRKIRPQESDEIYSDDNQDAKRIHKEKMMKDRDLNDRKAKRSNKRGNETKEEENGRIKRDDKHQRKAENVKRGDNELVVEEGIYKRRSSYDNSEEASDTVDSNRSNKEERKKDKEKDEDRKERRSRNDRRNEKGKDDKKDKKQDKDRRKRDEDSGEELHKREKKDKKDEKRKSKKSDENNSSDSESKRSPSKRRRSSMFGRRSKKKDLSTISDGEDGEICFKIRDGRFKSGSSKDADESGCCNLINIPNGQISKAELCRLINEFSTDSGNVNVEKLTRSLTTRANLPPKTVPRITVTPPIIYPSPQLTKEEIKAEEKCAKLREKVQKARLKREARAMSPKKGLMQRFKNHDVSSDTSTQITLSPSGSPEYVCQKIQGGSNVGQPPTGRLPYPVGQTTLMNQPSQPTISEYEREKKAGDDDEWLRAFEMVVKYDNAKDIRATQLKQEEMKLESKYLKQGQAKHFKRSKTLDVNGRGWANGFGGYIDVDKNPNRTKLDHLYDLIYALRGAPRMRPAKSINQESNDTASAPQVIPLYVPWELPQCDPYGSYYPADESGYENQGYYQQSQ